MSPDTKDQRNSALSNWFIASVVVILIVSGFAKMLSHFSSTKLLATPDPITGLSFGNLMLAAGVVEVVIAGVCLGNKSRLLSLALIAWLATSLVIYRLGLWWMGWKKPCNCLGNLTDALQISPQTADMGMKITLMYMLIGSYTALFFFWRKSEGSHP